MLRKSYKTILNIQTQSSGFEQSIIKAVKLTI